MKEYMSGVPSSVKELSATGSGILKNYDTLEEFSYRLKTPSFNQKWRVFGGPKMVADKMASTNEVLEKEKNVTPTPAQWI